MHPTGPAVGMNPKPSSLVMTIAGLTVVLAGCTSSTTSPPAAVANSPTTTTSGTPVTTATTTATTATTSVAAKLDPVDPPFRAKMNSLCQAWLADGNQKPPPFYMGNPLGLTREQLPPAASYLDALALNHDLLSSTSKLGTPAAGAEAWSTLRSAFETYQQHQNAAIAAAKAADLTAWTTDASAADGTRDAILSDLGRAGFPANDSCRVLFSRATYHGE